ncbi:hypothetical protein E2C01_001089 [Portunus trituberculatus]|uniref:Uncharacterized protein n=1 Tax=Portunus trituberculatus TaxID=210409 RepID=A0A5B7CLM3_PORTR|nr:hypothetical protein [Portunus trituberculatus]
MRVCAAIIRSWCLGEVASCLGLTPPPQLLKCSPMSLSGIFDLHYPYLLYEECQEKKSCCALIGNFIDEMTLAGASSHARSTRLRCEPLLWQSINSAFIALPSLHTHQRPPLRTIDTLKRCGFHEQATVGTSRHRCCSPSHIASLTIKKVFLGRHDRRAKLTILSRYVCDHPTRVACYGGDDGCGSGGSGGHCMTEEGARAGLVPIKAAAPTPPPQLHRRLPTLGRVPAATSRVFFTRSLLERSGVAKVVTTYYFPS